MVSLLSGVQGSVTPDPAYSQLRSRLVVCVSIVDTPPFGSPTTNFLF